MPAIKIINISRPELDTESEVIQDDLKASLQTTPTPPSGLPLSGAEVLGFLAVKVLVPIAASFVGRVLYDKYKELRTRKAAGRALEDLCARSGAVGDPVPEEVVVEEVTDVVALSLDREQAQVIVQRAYRRMQAKFLYPAPGTDTP